MNLNVHFHVVFLDGVFAKNTDGNLAFHPLQAPSQTEIATVVADLGRRVKNMLRRRGLLRNKPVDDEHEGQSALDACMQAGLSRGEFRRLDDRDAPPNEDAPFDNKKRSPWSAELDGFSVHAGVRMRQGDALGRERLLRYCARPSLSLERLSVLRDGTIAYRVKYPKRNGRTHLVMTPLQFMARLAALVPPPRIPLVRYSGVLAPASKWRAEIVPHDRETKCNHEAPDVDPAPRAERPSTATGPSRAHENAPPSRDKFAGRTSTSYIDWATLMKRGMGIDVLSCPRCTSRLKPIGVITEPDVIEKILVHLNLPLRPEQLHDGMTIVYDVTGEPVFDELWSAESEEWAEARGPPGAWDGVDAPSPCE